METVTSLVNGYSEESGCRKRLSACYLAFGVRALMSQRADLAGVYTRPLPLASRFFGATSAADKISAQKVLTLPKKSPLRKTF